jgi:hypothetical protein
MRKVTISRMITVMRAKLPTVFATGDSTGSGSYFFPFNFSCFGFSERKHSQKAIRELKHLLSYWTNVRMYEFV